MGDARLYGVGSGLGSMSVQGFGKRWEWVRRNVWRRGLSKGLAMEMVMEWMNRVREG